MNKFFLLLLIMLLFSCSSPLKKDINKMLDIKVEEGLKVLQPKDLAQVIITRQIVYFLIPLFVGLFSGIILVVSGVRVIGFGVVLASIACIVIIITITVYLKLIAVVGILVLVVGTCVLGKNLYDTAIAKRELVSSLQLAKNYISADDKKELSIALTKEQSNYTRKLVQEIKKK